MCVDAEPPIAVRAIAHYGVPERMDVQSDLMCTPSVWPCKKRACSVRMASNHPKSRFHRFHDIAAGERFPYFFRIIDTKTAAITPAMAASRQMVVPHWPTFDMTDVAFVSELLHKNAL
jgi:hypothetical protein